MPWHRNSGLIALDLVNRIHRIDEIAMTPRIRTRIICSSDIDAIVDILCEVSPLVPVDLSTREHIEAMKKQVGECYMNEYSIVALNENDEIIGFQLAKERIDYQRCQIYLAYAAVASKYTGNGIFRRLIDLEKQHNLPMVAEVKPDNKSNMAAILARYGFQQPHYGATEFRWEPAVSPM